jgi:hypothetical protein
MDVVLALVVEWMDGWTVRYFDVNKSLKSSLKKMKNIAYLRVSEKEDGVCLFLI